ncbi:hypothetical protein [Mesorhizobium helmanticense]|uniref:Uncharacterized protein n=1 Tax=Mesorhizobium helmanticense TaxID=1776423 RepID=A0A2T4IWX0_9HYPH|nr:hypothetical protein [Mesorhizobium helmanticense]PTE10150.1 hypothetical protein C9427_11395 [Mesorhizobium helmanticense]
MIRHDAKIDDLEVLTSGVLVFYKDQTVEIYPFVEDGDTDYKLVVTVALSDDADERANIKVIPDTGKESIVNVTVSRGFKPGPFSTTRPVGIANDKDSDFLLSCVVDIVGKSADRYTVIFTYTVLKKGRAGDGR